MIKTKDVVLLSVALLITILTGCTSEKTYSGDWNSRFIIWNGNIYVVQETSQVDQGKMEKVIGTIDNFSDHEHEPIDTKTTFSNIYPEGTKIYKIKDESTDDKIAVGVTDQKYVLAINTGVYGGK